jgi:hypothetical protein
MTDTIGDLFTGVESQKRQEIVDLMRDWKEEIASSKGKTNTWGKNENPEEYFVSDGFFPGYFNQKPKVLFIEREITFIPDERDWVIKRINDSKKGLINNNNFNSNLSYLVQGIKTHGKCKFENLEYANDYAVEMADTNDYGFAYMNISKYANVVKTEADWDSINQFLLDSNLEKRNFFREELEILEPDVIITGNLWNDKIVQKYLDLCFGKIKWEKINDDIDGKVNVSSIIINGKNVKLINAYHLASRYPAQEYFYDPVMKILFGGK